MNDRARVVDLKEICARLDAMAEDLASELLPRGRREGPYWKEAKRSAGGLGDSLKVNLHTGRWQWFAGDKFGDMLDLYCLVTNCSKTDGIRWARDRLGISGRPPAQVRQELAKAREEADRRRAERQAVEQRELENARAAAKGIFLGAEPRLLGTPAGDYFISRGIQLARLVDLGWGLHCLRYAPALYHPYAKVKLPAVVALVIFPDGRTASLHRTYLVKRDGRWDRMREEKDGYEGKLAYTKIHGGVIPLWRGSRLSKRGTGEVVKAEAFTDPNAGPDLRLIEGLENGMTCVQLDVDRRLAVALSLPNVLQLKLPAHFKRLTWIRDNDDEGSQADQLLERALEHLAELAAEDQLFMSAPPAGFKGFNDCVMPVTTNNNNETVPVPSHADRPADRSPAGAQ